MRRFCLLHGYGTTSVWCRGGSRYVEGCWGIPDLKSDAGVGIGTLIGDRDYLARKYIHWFDLPPFRFMFFDRNEIHIQAFQEISPAKLVPGDSSSSTFHEFQEFIISKFQKFRNSEFQKFKNGHLRFQKTHTILEFQISSKICSQLFPGCSLIFLDLIQVILSNKMKKYGLPEPKTLIIHEILSFRLPMP